MGLKQDPKGKTICPLSGKERMTRSQAKSTAKRQQASAYGNLTAYRCRACGGWHVGNKRRFAR